MLKGLILVVDGIIGLLKIPMMIVGIIVGIFYIIVMINIIISHARGKRFKKSAVKRKKKKSVFRRLFIDFPKQYVNDLYNYDPERFPEHGIIIFTGRQGQGKTIALTQAILEHQDAYPDVKTISNYGLLTQDEELDHWKKLLDFNNGKHGVIVGMDETQNWFSSTQSKDFPQEMLTVITQNRKNVRLIYGTAQSFHLLAKSLRSQAVQVRECYTLFKCLTIVRKRYPVLNSEGNVVEWQNRGMYFFVHDERVRSAYDTYKVVDSLSKSGFIPKVNISYVE